MVKQDRLGKHRILPFKKSRRNIELIVHEGFRKHSIHAIIEVDVTNAREKIRKIKQESSTDISFTGWLVKCVGEAVSKHKELNTFRLGKRKTVVFDDVDIPIPIERTTKNETRPMGYIIRKVNEKSVNEITKEIRAVQKETVNETTQVLGNFLTKGERFIVNAPMFIKKLAILILRRNGLFKKKHFGTVAVTSIGMKGNFPGWAIPMGSMTTTRGSNPSTCSWIATRWDSRPHVVARMERSWRRPCSTQGSRSMPMERMFRTIWLGASSNET